MPSTSAPALHPDDEQIDEEKIALRLRTRDARARRSARKRDDAAKAIAGHLLSMPEVQAAHCVSIYASRPTEPGTLPTIEALAARGVRVLLPVLGDGLERCWAVYRGADDLTQRSPGRPPEPSGEMLPQSSISDADVVIAPALSVDATGTRLGNGGGWYDRVLPEAKPGALLVALAFDEEVRSGSSLVPRARHDYPIEVVVTPTGVTRLPR